MELEYTRFGDTILQRPKDSSDEWSQVPEAQMPNALVEVRAAELMQERRATSKRDFFSGGVTAK